MNRYKLHEPKPDIAIAGEEVWFKHGDFWHRGIVCGYNANKQSYTIKDGQPPAFYFNVSEVTRFRPPMYHE